MKILNKADDDIVKEYWNWLCKMPRTESTLLNNDGDRDIVANTNRNGDHRDVIFLSFVLNGTTQRNIGNISDHKFKHVLIPSLCYMASAAELCGRYAKPDKINDVKEKLIECASADHANIEYRRIEIDGEPLVGDLEKYRVKELQFKVEYSKNGNSIFGVSELWANDKVSAVADGVYILWTPEKGQHTINFEGKVGLSESNDNLEDREYIENITYTLTCS